VTQWVSQFGFSVMADTKAEFGMQDINLNLDEYT
jgi:hypothetical protein